VPASPQCLQRLSTLFWNILLPTAVKDEFQMWKDALEEAYFDDYKEVNGKKMFTKLKVVRAGKTMIDSTLSDQKLADKLDAKLFEKP
jgi:hypothetical protein